MEFLVSYDTWKALMLANDPYRVYAQRRALGVRVWRGREWWM
jgi:hypothetical protein